MNGPHASIIWTALYVGSATSLNVGDAVISTPNGWLQATDANMATYLPGDHGIDGIALDPADPNRAFRVQVDGVLDASIFGDLGPGAIGYVKRGSAGRLVRTTDPTDPECVGKIRASGKVLLGLDGVQPQGGIQVTIAGSPPLPREKLLNLIPTAPLSITGADNPGNGSTDVTITPGTWQTALDVDFSAQATQTLSPDGSYTIAGIGGWQKQNSANDATAMAIANGSGLRIRPALGATYGTSTRTMPILWLPFSQFMPAGFAQTSRVRAMIELASDVLINGAACHLGIDDGLSTLDLAWDVFRSGSGGNTDMQAAVVMNGTRNDIQAFQAAAGQSTIGSTGVLSLRVPYEMSWGYAGHHVIAGFASPPMPAVYTASIVECCTSGVGNGGNPATLTTPTNIYPMRGKLGVFVGAEITGAGSYDVTIKRLRVEAWV